MRKCIQNFISAKRKRTIFIPTRQAIYMVLASGLLAASVALFFVDVQVARPLLQPFNFYRFVIMALAVIFLLLSSKKYWLDDKYFSADQIKLDGKSSKIFNRLSIGIPLAAFLLTLLQVFHPEFATVLVRKESWPFFRNAIFIKCGLQLIGSVLFITTALHYKKLKNYWGIFISASFALLLFIMAGEELSWGQRIFGWSSPEFIMQANAQQETNLHNFATQLFQNTLYFGGWLLLVGLSFWQNGLKKLLGKLPKINFVANWLPPQFFALIFACAFVFSDPIQSETGIYFGSNLFIVIATIVILFAFIYKAIYQKNNRLKKTAVVSLILYVLLICTNLTINRVWFYGAGAATEYLEVFINIGILTWAYYVSRTSKKLLNS